MSSSSSEYDVDCIVIGGGITGLITARNLAHNGVKVLLLEANDRLGGRIHDVYHRDDFYNHSIRTHGSGSTQSNNVIEDVVALGADKFDAKLHELLVKEIQRYGLHHRQHQEHEQKYFIRSSRLDVQSMKDYVQILETDVQFQTLCQRINSQAAELNRLTAFQQIDHPQLDIPLYDYLTQSLQCDDQSEIMEFFRLHVYMMLGAELETISTMMFLQLLNDFGSIQKLFDFFVKYDYIVEGFGALISCLASDILGRPGCNIRVSTPVITVTSISTEKPVVSTYDYPDPEPIIHSTRVKLATGEELHSRGTICTVPLNGILSIKWVPPLPPNLQHACERCNLNRNYLKLVAYGEGVSVRVNRLFNKLSYNHAFESDVKARKLLKIREGQREFCTLDEKIISENTQAPKGEQWKRMSVVSISSKRDEILAKNDDSIVRAFKLHHPDFKLDSLSCQHARSVSMIAEHVHNNPDSRILYHDFLSDRYIRCNWFNLRVGTGPLHYLMAQEAQAPWGEGNKSLYIASSDMCFTWTGWVEGSISIGIKAAEVMSPVLYPPKIIRNFAKKVT